MRDITDDFIRFLKEYGVIGLAIAVIIGNAAKDLVNAVVADVLMPIVELFLPGESWREATWIVQSVEFKIGHLIGAVLDFIIIAFLIYLFVRLVLRNDEVKKV